MGKMKKTEFVLIILCTIIFAGLAYNKLLPGMLYGMDTGAHLFRLIYLNKNLDQKTVPLWNTEWYTGAPFLLLYAPLAYYYSSFWPTNDYLLVYKSLEILFEFFVVISVYFLSKTLLKKRDLALLATFLFITMPQNIWNFSVVDRFTTLLEAFFFITGLKFFVTFLYQQKTREKIISGIFFGLAFLTQGFGYLIVLIILLFSKLLAWKRFKFKDLILIILISVLVASPWLLLSAGSYIYYIQNPYQMVWMVRKFIDIPRTGAILVSLGLPLVASLLLKFKIFNKIRLLIAILLILFSSTVFFLLVPLKYNITKPTIFIVLLLTALSIIVANKNIYKFDDNLNYLFYLTIFLIILSSSLFLYSYTPLGLIDPYRVAFYTSIPLAVLSAFILQKNKSALIVAILASLMISFTFLSTNYTKNFQIDEDLINTLKNAPEGRLLMVEAEGWMHIIPALTDKSSIDGFCPFERFLPYFRNLGYSNFLGLWFEGTTQQQIEEVYNQVFLNISKFAIKYIIIKDNSSIKIPDYLNYETIYNKNGLKVLMLKQSVNFAENATVNTISPNELIVYPKGDRILLKQTYFPGWQASCGKVKKSVDGLTIIENENCNMITLKYNPLSSIPQLLFKF
jgi:uncharacterized membrane protein